MRTILLRLFFVIAFVAIPTFAFAEDPVAAAILNLEGEGVDAKMTDTLTSIIRNEALQVEKYQVVNKYPIQLSEVVLMLDCSADSPSCLKQVARETKARLLIYGRVEKRNEQFKIELNVFDAETGRMLNRLVRTLNDTTDPVIGFRKEIEAFFAQQRGGALTRLQIGANVEGAQIRIEDTFVGVVPLERKGLPPGSYEIQIAHPDYEVWTKQVTLNAGDDERVWAQLVARAPAEPEPASDAVASAPTNTQSSQTQTTEFGPTDIEDTADTPRRGPKTSWGPWSAIVVGGAALGGAVAFGVALENVESTIETEAVEGTLTESRYQQLFSRGENYELAHRILLGVGAVSTVAGIIWLVVDSGKERASLRLTPTGVSATVRW